jgi:hypothetical protein
MSKMSLKPLVPKLWRRKVVELIEDIAEDMLSMLKSKTFEKSLYLLASKVIAVTRDDVEPPCLEVLAWVSHGCC